MAKSSKNAERRAVVEKMRKEQQRKERTRNLVILGGCTAVVVGLLAAALVPYIKNQRENKRVDEAALTSFGVSKTAASCSSISEKAAEGNNVHVAESTALTYPDAPPAFGRHYPTPADFSRKFYSPDDRPSLGHLVHNLEHGYNIVWYDASVAKDSDQVKTLKNIAGKFAGNDFTDKFIVAPWTAKDGDAFPAGKHIALTHWYADPEKPLEASKQKGVWKYCGATSGAVIADFVKTYPYTSAPEPNAM